MMIMTLPIRNKEPLTEREVEVLDLMQNGLRRFDVANHLQLSPNTVSTHIYNICRKLDVANLSDAIHKAQSLNLVN